MQWIKIFGIKVHFHSKHTWMTCWTHNLNHAMSPNIMFRQKVYIYIYIYIIIIKYKLWTLPLKPIINESVPQFSLWILPLFSFHDFMKHKKCLSYSEMPFSILRNYTMPKTCLFCSYFPCDKNGDKNTGWQKWIDCRRSWWEIIPVMGQLCTWGIYFTTTCADATVAKDMRCVLIWSMSL